MQVCSWMRRSGLGAALILFCMVFACERSSHLEERSTSIVNGAPDLSYPAIGAIERGGRTFCTGTLIGPRLVLTAGHCIRYLLAEQMGDLRFRVERLVQGGVEELSVEEIAAIMEIKAQTVRSARHKAMVKLRAHFEDQGGVL
ncbi:MAG: trypsin-like serine protease [Myxococcota bacterium]